MVDTFIVTDVGLNAVIDAANHGLTLKLSTFKIGSAFGYTPVRSDTALHGTVLYSDQITNFRTSADGSLVVTCTMSVDAGPFTFGEIGIYTDAGALFALASLAQPQTKYSSLGTNIASTYSFDAFIRLGQATAVITIDSVTTVTYAQVISALGFTPYNSTNPAGYLTATTGVTPNSNPQFFSIGVGTPATGVQGSITAVGNIYTTGNIQGFQTSDPKFKENIRRIQNPLDIIQRLGGYFFDWTDEYLAQEGNSGFVPKHDVGMMADQVHRHFSIAGRTKEDGTLAISDPRLIPLLVEGIRELANEVQLLRNEVATLKEGTK